MTQRLDENPDTRSINEIFALTIVNDTLKYRLNDPEHYSIQQSREIMKTLFEYILDGNKDVEVFYHFIRCMNQLA